jgi:hypothetical protein
MCGICGFFQVEKEADDGTLKRMNDQIIRAGGSAFKHHRPFHRPSTTMLAVGQFLDRL